MHDPLELLLADGVIDEISGRLKSGKEADLWLVRHGGHVIAAKVYKARHARSFRNNAGYKEGRQVRDTRTQRAMQRGSRFGQEAAEEAWKTKEADALHALHAAGVRVPTPVMFYEGVLLMELVVDAHGHPAPRLVDAHVPRERAAELYADLRAQAVRMLACHLIHGDLSPYNILLGASGPVVIDFPQVVGSAHNSQAESYFRRDLENVRRFFAALDPALHSRAGDAREIWRAYVRGELTPDFVPSGNVAEPSPSRRRDQARGEKRNAPAAAAAHEAVKDSEHRAHDRDRERHGRRRGHRDRDHGHQGGNRERHDLSRAHQDRSPAQQGRAHPQQDRREPGSRPGPGVPAHAGHTPHGKRPAGEAAVRLGGANPGQKRAGRRPTPPVPEVVRVVRPALGAAGTTTANASRGDTGRPHSGRSHPGPPSQSKPAPPSHRRPGRGPEHRR